MRTRETVDLADPYCSKLLNKVVAGTVPENKINTKSAVNQFEVNAMHGLALAGAKNIGCQVVNIGPDDLTAGTPHLVLGLVWQIVRVRAFFEIVFVSSLTSPCTD